MGQLEVIQRKAACQITGQYKATHCDILLLEADLQSCKTECERACLRSFEKAKRLPTTHLLRKALDTAAPPKNKHRSWYTMGKKLSERLLVEDDSRLPIKALAREPWTESVIEHEIVAELPGITGRNDTEVNKLLASCKAIEEAGQTVTIYTNGSAAAGTRDGEAAAVITSNDPVDPQERQAIRVKGRHSRQLARRRHERWLQRPDGLPLTVAPTTQC